MLDMIIAAVRKSGDILLSAQDIGRSVKSKEGKANFVTKYDTLVQESLHKMLLESFPGASFVAEEDNLREQGSSGLTFIIDPIDGTTNFIKGYRKSCISVGAARNNEALDVRRSGSVALDLCDVAAGRIGLFYEFRLSPWDYAAGSLIVTEAGGIAGDMEGNPLPLGQRSSVLAGGAQAYRDFMEIMKKELPY